MNDERIIAYLLNELSRREAKKFEAQCFAQPEWPEEELECAEEDLIQAYLKEKLSAKRRWRFEKYYLTTEARKHRLLLARALQRNVCPAVDTAPLSRRQRLETFLTYKAFDLWAAAPKLAAISLPIGLAVLLAWFAFRPKMPQTFAHLNLTITSENRAESGHIPTVKLVEKDALRISLALSEPALADATFRVQWEDVKGPINDLNIEKQDAHSISVVIPTEKLKPGQYVLKLFRKTPDGAEQRVGNYLFNVE